ncbi:ribosomal protein S12 methylthiotransferase accessory factor [Lipingzhangella halophila]|uniref:Ribosomal protein S12 methylthiotransferase accessory factor n=1 Tax=Lipingzhangella halophila TaxID=1783352 RepID=A0A7W7RMH5_9ACTN|nr:TOMM precursor leader peptide-binding protein [Lipingzhangella halophila]MBB4934492.1 ribosomal protein S12 methylthiotransferase accessory factor [Lipingzhangella halophila]
MTDSPAMPTHTRAATRGRAGHVRVTGDGLLAAAVTKAVRAPDGDALPDLASSVSDAWREDWGEHRAWGRNRGVPWLPVRTELGIAVLGPLERTGVPGCLRCVETRRELAHEDPDGALAVRTAHRGPLSSTPSSLLTTLAAGTVAELVAAEAARLALGDEPRTAGALLRLDLRTLQTSRHRFLADPLCPDCAPPDDGEPIALRSRPKPAPDCYRLRPSIDPAELRARYVDSETGVLRELWYENAAGMALVHAPVRFPGTRQRLRTEFGFGRSRDFRTSETVAICEALERYGGIRQGARSRVLRARYRDIADRAIDVDAVGTHPPESYELADFRCRAFDPDREYGWVTGYSFARGGPVLVPERMAYYGSVERAGQEDPPFVLDSSNGAALGSCLEEAILHGLLEIVERDAFLLSWHARMPVPAIAPDSAADRTIPLLVAQIKHELGYRVTVHDTTLDHGIPSVWAMATRLDGDVSRPQVSCAGSAHPQPERAIVSALAELGPILADLVDRFPTRSEHVADLVRDSDHVQQLEDHVLLYSDSRVFDRFDFLADCRTGVPISEAFGAGTPRIAGADLTDDLLALVSRLRDSGLDVVAVDQTTPEHRAAGLSCAKVFVPGALPMSFGHRYRRLHGLPRLREIPARLGYADRPLRDCEITTHPHPFP